MALTKGTCSCLPTADELPAEFFTVLVGTANQVDGFRVDYEIQRWRAKELARHIFEWIPDFALTDSERAGITAGRIMEKTADAVRRTFGRKFDPSTAGEILLHAICRAQFGASTVINKVWFKSSFNMPYHGFDGVHVVHSDAGLELWLGEAKFYKNAARAVDRVIADMKSHLDRDYLHDEFALVGPKMSADHPHAAEIRKLMAPNTSLDEVFQVLTLPVLIMYDSPTACSHTKVSDEYVRGLADEISAHAARLLDGVDAAIRPQIRAFFIPMANKHDLVDHLKLQVDAWS